MKHNFVSFKKVWLLERFQYQPADDNEELEQQQSQILLFRFQPIRRFLDTLQQLVAQNLQDVVWKEWQHRRNLLRPGDKRREEKN